MGYFKIELIHTNGARYYTEWDIESDECEKYTESEYVAMITSYSVSAMTSISVFDFNDIEIDMEFEELEEFKKHLEWGELLDIDMECE